jgi:hypothetical protein
MCRGWLWTEIVLISASWVARITGMSHQYLAQASNSWLSCLNFPSPGIGGINHHTWWGWSFSWHLYWTFPAAPPLSTSHVFGHLLQI